MPEKAMHMAPASAAKRGRRAMASSGPIPRPVSVVTLRSVVSASPRRRLLGHADEPQTELLELRLLRVGRGFEHRVAARLRLREGHHFADVGLLGEQSCPAVDAEGDAAVRRRTVLERVEDRAELLVHALDRVALQEEAALEQIALVDP